MRARARFRRFVAGALLCAALLPGALMATPAAAAGTPAAATDDDAARTALALLDHLDAQRFDRAEAMFDGPMRAAVPAARLRAIWESLPGSVGRLTSRGTPQANEHRAHRVVRVPLQHERAALLATITIGADGRIAGFLVQPAPPPPAAALPPSADTVERALDVGAGATALPGTLALPRRASRDEPVPAVVLVHGSGPQDRDETIGPNRPFLDLARGLAGRGVAVLRYEKRTRARPQAFTGRDFTIDEETTDDAVAAVATLRSTAGVDPARVFVLGHSQGGMLAPRIVARSGAAGAVLLAAPARPLLDLLVEQNRRLAAIDGTTSAEEESAIANLVAQVARARGDASAPASALPLGLPAVYWRSIDAVDAVADARALERPLLVLHGGRDLQVVDADWSQWQQAFAASDRVTLKRYEALNHLGIAGKGPPSLAEYQIPGHVDAGLIDDIAAWIAAQPRAAAE